MELPLIDIIIVIAYLVGLLLFGLWFSRFVKTDRDYFLAGRSLPFWAIGMSIVVSDIGAVDFVSLCGASYKYGIVAANMDWIGTMPAIILAAFIFIPHYWRAGVYSVPEYLGRRFNPAVRGIQTAVWTLFLVVNLALVFWATATMFDTLLGPDLWQWTGIVPEPSASSPDPAFTRKMLYVVITAVFTGAYTISGGLAAVVYTDVVQMVIMFAGALVIVGLGLYHPDLGVGGFSGLRETLVELDKTDHLTLFFPADTTTPFPWHGVLLGLALVQAPAYFIGNQAIVQRTLGARDEWAAKAGTLFGGFLKFFIPLLVVLPGLLAVVLVPGLEDVDTAFPELVRRLLPIGLRGIVFAGFLAAMMSSVDSIATSAATLVTHDVYTGLFRARPSDRSLLIIGRTVTLALFVFGVITASAMEGDTLIYGVIQHSLAVVQGPTWGLILLGMLWRRATPAGGLWGLIAGLAVSIGLTFWQKAPWFETRPFESEEPFMFIAAISFAVTVVALAAVSLATRPLPPERIRGLVYKATLDDADAQDALNERAGDEESP